MINRMRYLTYRLKITWMVYNIRESFGGGPIDDLVFTTFPGVIQDPFSSKLLDTRDVMRKYEAIVKAMGYAEAISMVVMGNEEYTHKEQIGERNPNAHRTYSEIDRNGVLITMPICPINLSHPLEDIIDYIDNMKIEAEHDKLKMSWAQLGLEFTNGPQPTDIRYVYQYITVPERSFNMIQDDCDIELAGENLVQFYENYLETIGNTNVVLKATIRKGDIWTEERAEAAINAVSTERQDDFLEAEMESLI